MQAIRIHETGNPEVLKYEECPDPVPGPGEALVDVQAIGINFTDVVTRRGGANPPPVLPMTPGMEAAGVVEAVGEEVTAVKVGDPVVYCAVLGAYAERVTVPAEMLVPIPDGLDARTSAAVLLQGMTAHFLAYGFYSLKPGDSVLVHAGAGGTGLLLVQLAKRTGAYVFATVSTDEKAALTMEAGADRAIVYTREDFGEEIRQATDGRGVQVVYDSVGIATFDRSLRSLARRGYLALYGQASGPVPPLDTARLYAGGSLFVTRPSLLDYTATREELLGRAGEVLNWAGTGELKVNIGGTFALSEAADAHRQLEGRHSTGKLLLIP